MLKLTNSFCRYLKFTCENIKSYSNRTHLKKITHIANKNPTCNGVRSLLNLCFATPFIDTGQYIKFYGTIKKRFNPKQTSKHSNVLKKFKQMSESLQPTIEHVSYGGKFEISSSDNSCSGSEWKKTLSNSPDSSSSASNCMKLTNDESSNSTDTKEASCIPPNFRVWEQVLKNSDAPDDGKAFKFKILSYNVLAQYLLECHPYLYTECHPHNLKWKVRSARIYDEIINLSPDILCLQEVQASHRATFYSKFEEIGYFGIFKQKTGERHDGCAIYFKQSMFTMIDHFTVEYYQPGLPILNRDNIGVMVKLMPKSYIGPPVVVATTHLLYNPKRTDVRLAQMQLLLAEIDRFAYCYNGQEPGHLPVIITGDLNSTPDSAVVNLLDKGEVGVSPFRDSSDWKRIGVTDKCQHISVYLNRRNGFITEFCMTKIYNSDYRVTLPLHEDPIPISSEYTNMFNSGIISHSLNLQSTYTKCKPDGNHEATTFQDHWVTVDYIYFSKCSNLNLVERLRLPTAAECDTLGRLPNDAFGSDHLALAAVFELKPAASSL